MAIPNILKIPTIQLADSNSFSIVQLQRNLNCILSIMRRIHLFQSLSLRAQNVLFICTTLVKYHS